ncbi:hypothetical protein IE979_08785 [Klebsiella pneumoniae]|uniref:TonB-dependent hemin, ferrichrome receptor n=1 Tax=Klebsiella pneumoniae TaxID=573 RepID=A0A927DCX3_KLEPN|nr:hypothetical protein [Klebsiella pneumoniae]MBD3704425.1 hypothetical protein [Klebsiella pneumoniae]MBD3705542.1 hypothetical protein [Klebsiella pneumoniae]MBD3715881.1 hypothetical protein [Klebsiella pneumoniae]
MSSCAGFWSIAAVTAEETENNSGTVDAYPANWHSDAFLASGIWQPNDEHKLTSTFDYYHKTNHTHYDTSGLQRQQHHRHRQPDQPDPALGPEPEG